TDARGEVTDYTYDSTHGGVTTATLPSPGGGAPRPETRYTYESYTHNNVTTWRLTETSSCSAGSAPSCVGTAAETKTTMVYPSSGTASRLPVSATTAAGDASVSSTTAYTWTDAGDLETVDGPLSGSADVTR